MVCRLILTSESAQTKVLLEMFAFTVFDQFPPLILMCTFALGSGHGVKRGFAEKKGALPQTSGHMKMYHIIPYMHVAQKGRGMQCIALNTQNLHQWIALWS